MCGRHMEATHPGTRFASALQTTRFERVRSVVSLPSPSPTKRNEPRRARWCCLTLSAVCCPPARSSLRSAVRLLPAGSLCCLLSAFCLLDRLSSRRSPRRTPRRPRRLTRRSSRWGLLLVTVSSPYRRHRIVTSSPYRRLVFLDGPRAEQNPFRREPTTRGRRRAERHSFPRFATSLRRAPAPRRPLRLVAFLVGFV